MREWYCKVNETPGKQEGGTMREISQERIERFWKWCGFSSNAMRLSEGGWNYPSSGWDIHLPKVDLNNLFKWAVPKLFNWGLSKNWELRANHTLVEKGVRAFAELKLVAPEEYDTSCPSEAIDDDPATALFLAIEKLIEEGV